MTKKIVTPSWIGAAFVVCLVLAMAGSVDRCLGQNLVAHWKLDEPASPYADSSTNHIPLVLDTNTTPAYIGVGVNGSAAQLRFDNPPGTSTCLVATNAAIQTASFGFSFWVKPVNLNPFDNFIMKERPYDSTDSDPSYAKMDWQVHLLGNNGSGQAQIEFVVRGDVSGGYYGSVASSSTLPLTNAVSSWYHICGGYDATTGALTLFVDGVENDGNGTPGAPLTGGGAFDIGTGRNGTNFVQFAASAYIDDVQLYDDPIANLSDATFLMNNPGLALGETPAPTRGLIAHWKLDESGSPYADTSTNHIPLILDTNTAPAYAGVGADGLAAQLRFDNPPGTSTSLVATNAALQTPSFGFSFWVKPVNLNPFDNFIMKERPYASYDNDASYAKMDWQVHLLGNNGSGQAQVEFVVRGDVPGGFYGAVQSTTTLPLTNAVSSWYHICGGYDATYGALTLFVDGVENDGNGNPGAPLTGGGAIDIGTGRNGTNFVQFAAAAYIDDVQIYDTPIEYQSDALYLMNNPGLAIGENPTPTSQIIAHWKFDDIPGPSAPYVDSGPNGINLYKDSLTTPPGTGVGQDAAGCVRLLFSTNYGISTRLYATNSMLQQNSFGFSLWLNPVDPAPGNNVLLKEMAPDTNVVNDFEKLSWQLHFLGTNNSGNMPLELIVRGDNRTNGNFFGAVQSAAIFQPYTNSSPGWVHVAGGYDAVTGELRLFVGTNCFVSGNSSPGADNSDGSPLSIGTAKYGTNYQFFAAGTYVDDVQIYADALTSAEVDYLGNPANFGAELQVPKPLNVSSFSFIPTTGDATLAFDSMVGTNYTVEVSTNLPTFIVATNFTAVGTSTSVTLRKSFIDGILGTAPRPQLFLRVKQQ